jgi:hypothetical protein
MQTGTLSGNISFRAEARMVADILDHQQARGLRKFSDAARELMDTACPAIAQAVAECRRLKIDPVATLRDRIAQVSS